MAGNVRFFAASDDRKGMGRSWCRLVGRCILGNPAHLHYEIDNVRQFVGCALGRRSFGRHCRNVGVFEIAIHLISMGYPCRNYETDSG